jgi:hypothetical protein
MAMAGLPWIKVWTVVGAHPKVQRLEKELGIRDALGVVVRLWCWTADYCPDGEISAESMTIAVRVARGEATRRGNEAVTQALILCGFIDRVPQGFRVHDWSEMQTVHVETVEKKREQNRLRQEKHRKKLEEEEARRNALVMRDVTRDGERDVTPGHAGEKRRVEKKETREDLRPFPCNSQPSIPPLGVVRGDT